MEFVTESGVVSVVVTCQRVVEHGEWSGVRYRDLSESSGCCDPGGVPKAQGTKAKAKVHHS